MIIFPCDVHIFSDDVYDFNDFIFALFSEKDAMKSHYMMYYEMSFNMNAEVMKQTEIAKRYSTILTQVRGRDWRILIF